MTDLDPRLHAAFSSLELDAVVLRDSLVRMRHFWHTAPEPERDALLGVLDTAGAAEVFDAFSRDLAFGTGGCRARVGLGPNRMNPTTLSRLVRAHAGWMLRHERQAARRGVVLGWDTRCFHDVDGVYASDAPPSLLGWTSAQAARTAALEYTRCGIDVHWPGDGGTVGALSFAVRHLGAAAGLYISASHNPPDHNGAKFYAATGGQVVPPDDDAIAHSEPAPWVDEPGNIAALDESVRDAWLDALHDAAHRPDLAGVHVVYTALQGAGARWVPRVLSDAGARVDVVASQHAPNGTFAAVPGASPNPENRAALSLALEQAARSGADLVLATDPDADRIGVACRSREGWRVLSGNEIALLCTEQVARRAASGSWVLQTGVTTTAVARLARLRGLRVRDDAPVGFKYLGVQMDRLDGPFALAVEESHGVLISDALRDKDAVGAALLVAAAASHEPLAHTLARLDAELGPTRTLLTSRGLQTGSGRARLAAAMSALRAHPPRDLAGSKVVALHDALAGQAPTCASEAAARDVLRFELADGVLTLRPSGTEARVKVYAERWGDPGTDAEALESSLVALTEAVLERITGDAARTGPGTAG